MDIRLSWDLMVLVLLIVIVAYSFIIGRDSTIKVILGTYIAAIAADSCGFLFQAYFGGSAFFMNVLQMASVQSEEEAIILVKVLIFVALVIVFAVKGAFSVKTAEDRSTIVRIMILGLYSLMSAGLIISVILVFVSGTSLFAVSDLLATNAPLGNLARSSQFIHFVVKHAAFLFAVPAFSFLIHSLYSRE